MAHAEAYLDVPQPHERRTPDGGAPGCLAMLVRTRSSRGKSLLSANQGLHARSKL